MRARESRNRSAVRVAVVLLTFYAAALRADVVVTRLGANGSGGAAYFVERIAAPIGAALRPSSVSWKLNPRPYVGGDPINYIRYAREMQSFYQPHVREPVFLALTRGFLTLLRGRDVAVSYASAFASTLVVPAAYLLGSAAFGPVVGLLAAAGWAIEFEAISWSADGWRDDTFTLFFTLSAWAFVRLRQQPVPSSAVLAGVITAGACLTRLSSLPFVAAGSLWTILEPASRDARAKSLRMVACAALVTAGLVGPYLLNCWRVYGDPFYAVNYHTVYYRHAEGLREVAPESAAHFAARQFREAPVAAFDTAIGGLFAWPFNSKWRGFVPWSPHLMTVAYWSAIAGLVTFLWSANGRLLLVLLIASLTPYALTYSLSGGGAWRFSEHVYPIYLIAAGLTWKRIWDGAAAAFRDRANWRSWHALATRRRLVTGALIAVAAGVIVIAYYALPLLVVRETLAITDEATIEAGARERWFFSGAWSPPRRRGAVVVRVAKATDTAVRFVLREPMPLWITLKMDPPETANPSRQPSVTVFFNGQRLGELHLTRDPARMGAYHLEAPAWMTRAGVNALQLVSSHTVPAREGGRQFRWVGRDTPVAFRLWYVRLQAIKQ